MPAPLQITSTQNPRIKAIALLQKKPAERREQGLFVFEGFREMGLAIAAGVRIRTLLFCPAIGRVEHFEEIRLSAAGAELIEVSEAVFESLAYRDGSDGLLAVAQSRTATLDRLRLSANPLILVLEGVEKPGNLGAILRTADAAAVDAVVVCDPRTDFENPNVIRSSVGCVFTCQVAACTTAEAFHWLQSKGIRTYAAALSPKAVGYHTCSYEQPSAIIMGTEADGLSAEWLDKADQHIVIPMRGQIDSLNVSNATAILTFEAMRQRGFR